MGIPPIKPRTSIRWRNDASDLLYAPFAYAGLAITIVLAVVGLWQIIEAVWHYWLPGKVPEGDPLSQLVTHVLKGVEVLFLAPLAYLIVLIFGDYMRCVLFRSEWTAEVHEDVQHIKSLSASLLIAVVATDLIQKILSQDGLKPDHAVYEGLVVIVLSIYLLVLQRVSGARPKGSSKTN